MNNKTEFKLYQCSGDHYYRFKYEGYELAGPWAKIEGFIGLELDRRYGPRPDKLELALERLTMCDPGTIRPRAYDVTTTEIEGIIVDYFNLRLKQDRLDLWVKREVEQAIDRVTEFIDDRVRLYTTEKNKYLIDVLSAPIK